MGINKSWETTLAFRRFRKKTNQLSHVYWTQQMGVDCLRERLMSEDPNDIASKIINVSFVYKMYPKTNSEVLTWLDTYMERNRLHILVICCANLEAYLKEVTFAYLASLGHKIEKPVNELLTLTETGKALGAPILASSTLPDMVKYAKHLWSVDFGTNETILNTAYKLRCTTAHNGGMIMPKTAKEIPTLQNKEFDMLGLDWEELRKTMKAADDIAATIDHKISNYQIRLIETEQILRFTYSKNKLPNQKNIWHFLHNGFHLFPIRRQDKNELISKFYTTPKQATTQKRKKPKSNSR